MNMHGLPKNEVWDATELFGYSESDLLELRQFVMDSYYNAFLRHYVYDKSTIGDYLKREVCANGKTRQWKIHAWNDLHMERDGIQVVELGDDGSDRLIIDLSNWELERMWKVNCH